MCSDLNSAHRTCFAKNAHHFSECCISRTSLEAHAHLCARYGRPFLMNSIAHHRSLHRTCCTSRELSNVASMHTDQHDFALQAVHAFEMWHAQHAVKVRTLLEARTSASHAAHLAQPLGSVIAHLAELFRLKEVVVRLSTLPTSQLARQHLPSILIAHVKHEQATVHKS